MRKLILALTLVLIAGFAACGRNETTLPEWQEGEIFTLTIGATPNPHMVILGYIAPYLLEDGVALEIIEFTDFPLVNPALADGTLDANYFQHQPFLDDSPLADVLYMVGLVHLEPMGAYSNVIDDIAELPFGATIALPNCAVNQGRALLLLQTNGLIRLDPDAGIRATYLSDITYNPLNLQFRGLDAALVPRALEDPLISLAVINTNHVLAGTNLNPQYDNVIIETQSSPYFANGLTVRRVDREHPAVLLLIQHLQSDRVREFIYREYGRAVIPVF